MDETENMERLENLSFFGKNWKVILILALLFVAPNIFDRFYTIISDITWDCAVPEGTTFPYECKQNITYEIKRK